jgi:hypothetical protein
MSDAGGLKSLLLLSQAVGVGQGSKSNTTTAVPCLNPGLTRKSIIAVDACGASDQRHALGVSKECRCDTMAPV